MLHLCPKPSQGLSDGVSNASEPKLAILLGTLGRLLEALLRPSPTSFNIFLKYKFSEPAQLCPGACQEILVRFVLNEALSVRHVDQVRIISFGDLNIAVEVIWLQG